VTQDKPPSPDFDELAKKYLDLWQQQIAGLARDPAKMTDAATAWSQMASSFLAASPNPFTATPHDSASAAPSAHRPAPASAPPGAGGLDPLQLLRRLDDIERRLSALESQPGAKRSRAPARGRGGGAKP
jgi:hypothetical protein